MIKFIIITRAKPGWTRERFFYEWAFIHVSLMLHTAPSMRRFRRYVQHFVNPDIPDSLRVLPHPKMNWENFAEHWLEKFEFVHHPDYTEQMQPHKFSDTEMEIVYVQGECMYLRDDFRSGGVKLIHRLAIKPGQPVDAFRKYWQEEHAPAIVNALKEKGLRKYEINLPYDYDAAAFKESRKGTLFEKAALDAVPGLEEFWFDSIEDAVHLGRDPELRKLLTASYERFVDVEKSYSLFANERVVFDFVTPGETTPLPAVLDPNSLDATVFKTGRPYHEPKLSS